MELLSVSIVFGALVAWFAFTMLARLKEYRELDEKSDLDK